VITHPNANAARPVLEALVQWTASDMAPPVAPVPLFPEPEDPAPAPAASSAPGPG
jgi:hypothetical protein